MRNDPASCSAGKEFLAVRAERASHRLGGIDINHLIMMLTGTESIRDVIPFPQLKRKE